MNKSILFLFLFFTLLVSQAGAITFPNNVDIPVQAVSISLLALSFSLDVVAIGYIISKIFPQTGINEWLQREYWEIAKSAMLIVSIYAIITFMTNISLLFLPSSVGAGCPSTPSTASYRLVNGACGYLSDVERKASDSFNFLLGLSSNLGALESLSVSAYLPIPIIPVIGFKFGFIIYPYTNSMLEGTTGGQFQSVLNDIIAYVAFPVALLVEVQRYILPFLFVIGLTVIIPIGLIFRAMPFTRREIGGTLIGIGIGISIVYPSLLIVLNYPVTNALQIALGNPSTSCSAGIFCYAIDAVLNALSSVRAIGLTVGVAVGSLQSIMPALDNILWYNMYMVLQLVLFIFDLGIGFSVSNGIARLLGGNIRLGISGKIKLA